FGSPATTALAVDPEALVIHSFSKRFSMTGWRLGWMVVPEALHGPVLRLAQNLAISAPTLSQVAAVRAFEATGELDGHVRRYAANREVLLRGLPEAGLDRFVAPEGAFYVYVDVSEHTDDAVAFCEELLREAGVACTPGVDFDEVRGRHHVRLSFAGRTAEVEEACRRLGRHLRARRLV
ncbi:MAG: aminotransferase class I/II-fold pyridoxal phosphate-dependent enzyme, partial [Myxococcales bacterium]|nr:aminotransferase class I/II-fold pyridoxal phosphate-dependent enzyme [Myxococcales bacterium]